MRATGRHKTVIIIISIKRCNVEFGLPTQGEQKVDIIRDVIYMYEYNIKRQQNTKVYNLFYHSEKTAIHFLSGLDFGAAFLSCSVFTS